MLLIHPISSFTEINSRHKMLKSKIEKLTWVDSVITGIDVPLLKVLMKSLMDKFFHYVNLRLSILV